MQFVKTTVHALFNGIIQLQIPDYQRAYSWELPQLQQFLDDLLELKDSDEASPYCLGNILLETIKQDKQYFIIDGQQRITTIVIFLSIIINEALKRHLENIDDMQPLNQLPRYLKDGSLIKFRPVQYDQICFDTIIIENKNEFEALTSSQKRIIQAKQFFSEKLSILSDDDICFLYKRLTNSIINKIALSGSKEAALMFELQNNRGVTLTNLERLKSYLMYQLYVYSPTALAENDIKYVSQKFDGIYPLANILNELLWENDEDFEKVALSEDNILLYHSIAYSNKHFAYRKLEDTFEELKNIEKTNKVQWIKDYVDELYNSFSNIKKVVSINNNNLSKLKRLKMPSFIWPFIILGMKFLKDDKTNLSKLFSIMEILSFRYKLIGSRADIRSRLSDPLKYFAQNGDLTQLEQNISQKMQDAWFWSDTQTKERLEGYMYQNPVLHYLLWEYEEFIQPKGYKFGSINIEDESIEHISPQVTDDQWIESGYDVDENNKYTADFKDNYLNCIGNLMLISKSHNSAIGNEKFSKKLETYKHNPLLKQQAEIVSFTNTSTLWTQKEITLRKRKIINFALNRWSFNKK